MPCEPRSNSATILVCGAIGPRCATDHLAGTRVGLTLVEPYAVTATPEVAALARGSSPGWFKPRDVARASLAAGVPRWEAGGGRGGRRSPGGFLRSSSRAYGALAAWWAFCGCGGRALVQGMRHVCYALPAFAARVRASRAWQTPLSRLVRWSWPGAEGFCGAFARRGGRGDGRGCGGRRRRHAARLRRGGRLQALRPGGHRRRRGYPERFCKGGVAGICGVCERPRPPRMPRT